MNHGKTTPKNTSRFNGAKKRFHDPAPALDAVKDKQHEARES